MIWQMMVVNDDNGQCFGVEKNEKKKEDELVSEYLTFIKVCELERMSLSNIIIT